MLSLVYILAISRLVCFSIAQGVILPDGLLAANPGDNAVGAVWSFDNETWIENLAVRSNGEILCTSLNRAEIYLVNTFGRIAILVHKFDSTDSTFGITEIGNDVFAVVTANFSLETSTIWPGSAKIWKVDMTAYTVVGPPDASQNAWCDAKCSAGQW